jgi:hypothetical protein
MHLSSPGQTISSGVKSHPWDSRWRIFDLKLHFSIIFNSYTPLTTFSIKKQLSINQMIVRDSFVQNIINNS